MVDANGEISTSNLRHLDGSVEECFDPSIYGFDPDKRGDTRTEDNDWIKLTPTALYITASCSSEMHTGIFTTTGLQVYTRSYGGAAEVNDVIPLNQFVAGTYVVTVTCDGKRQSKRIVIR